jgi:hypothetical protein
MLFFSAHQSSPSAKPSLGMTARAHVLMDTLGAKLGERRGVSPPWKPQNTSALRLDARQSGNLFLRSALTE